MFQYHGLQGAEILLVRRDFRQRQLCNTSRTAKSNYRHGLQGR